jgi:hypothetical protein
VLQGKKRLPCDSEAFVKESDLPYDIAFLDTLNLPLKITLIDSKPLMVASDFDGH